MAPVFYATVDADSIRPSMPAGVPVLLPATSFARRGFPTPRLPSQIHEAAADSGGFVAMRRGGYPFLLHEYAA